MSEIIIIIIIIKSKRSEYFDDFEIITEANEDNLNESAFLEQNESKNMETSSEAEMSAQDKPKPKPRNRETYKDYDLHSKRETKWMNEKDDLLATIENLEESLKQKDEELQEQNSRYEEVYALENEKEELQNKCVELEEKNAEFVSEKERACEIIKELQERSEETTGETQAHIQELENEVDQLRKSLDEKNESCNEALEKIEVYESKESENEQRIQRLEEELAKISQQNDLGNSKMDELESTNLQIQEERAKGEEMLAKLKELYAELSTINDEMEKELHENKTKVRELTRENQQVLQEKNEMRRQIQITNEDLERQMEKLSNNAREIQNEKDKLESELVTMKLEQKHLTSENTSHSHDMQDMGSKVTKLIEERDFYDKKCKELEKGLKLNADQEISQLNQALEVLNDENNILRQRNMKLEGDVGGLLNVKTDLEAKVRNGNFGAENGGFSPEVSHSEEPIRQKLPERMDTSTRDTPPRDTPPRDTHTEQWYDTDEGGPLFAQIHREMNNKFSKVEIGRAITTKDISLSVTTDQRERFKVHFPRNFPSAAAVVNYGAKCKELRVSVNRNAPSELCTELIKMLCELVYG